MNLDFTDEELGFRDEVRAWLADNVPRGPRPLHDNRAAREYDLAWQRTQYDAGWAGIDWPVEYGGRGLSLVKQIIWYEEYARAGGPQAGVTFVGIKHGGPTLIARASEEQKSFHLPKILKGEAVWCQGFSEPGSGSDLASLRTRAILDGDHLVVTGQKIWTSFADVADYQELLVRTDPEAAKHRGITWVICDMHSPGIEIRPIETMEGGHDFCEVFYDEVRIPVDNVVGDLNDGWSVAMSTLSFERGTAFMKEQVELAASIDRLIELAADQPGAGGRGRAIDHDGLAERLATVRAEVAAVRSMTYATVSRNARQAVPGAEGSIIRLYFSELLQRTASLAMDVLGPDGLWLRSGRHDWSGRYLASHAETIGGGTAEIQREIIGERVLGLPRGR